ncbi:UNVERIFIED_CONTAM: Dynein light chain, cytoplasmic [Sesamum calycinum]|uniref:Dynein light chain, cytoplasmic n=1 Tax=Sesamum calycinum TaxID=2727403 RepID=A0AAW2N1T2_9LAMI
MASDRGNKPVKREGTYVYSIVPPASLKNAISKGWGSLVRSKTYRESSDHGEKRREEVAAESRKSVSIAQERRSVSSEVEANAAGSAAELLEVRVLASDMPALMQVHAFCCARTTFESLEKFSSKHMAYNIKKEFDKVYGPAWHCIVGSSFGSFVTHSTGCFLYFSMEKLYVLVFKTRVQRPLLHQI